MKVLILGAGVVGATTAYMLARDGCKVTVLERRESSGLETSFANGGQVSASHAEPWASPESLRLAMTWLGRNDAPLSFPLFHSDPALWAWSLRFLANCTTARARVNLERTLRVAAYSRAQLKRLNAELPLSYARRTSGILHVYRNGRDFDHARRAAEQMATFGLSRQVLTPDGCVGIEPALADAAPTLVGGLFSPDDESGDAFAFTQEMTSRAQDLGAEFRFGCTVRSLTRENGRLSGVQTDHGAQRADLFILAAASHSPALARTVGLRLPIYPAKGYSLTAPGGSATPTISVTDDAAKMVFSNLGGRLRAAGTAEFQGWNDTLTPQRTALILRNARALFPRGADYEQASYWCGLRPVTPDSTPILGFAPGIGNLLLNTGHGTLGWTMAVGSARIMADLAAGRTPEIDLDGLGAERFMRHSFSTR
ncbi:MAG: amino acid dehydrogenase [Alphaproteobacteria bacterium RIFOXYD12_FULL_60_8]|nr:MAG: amino acid dehydrogenase [Alphaproteobacteria bacterium RIFOXYD12_FULL_60_8]